MSGAFFPVERKWLVAGLLALLVAASYFNSLSNPFIWDDKAMIVHNEGLKQGWTSVLNAFSPARWAGRSDNPGFLSFFRPTQSLLSIADYQIWGLNPFGFHLSNMLLHLANTLLVLFFAARLTNDGAASVAAAAIFAVHPVHTESVTFIAARCDLLAGLFMMASFIFYMRSGRVLSVRYGAALLLFLMALLSKEMAVTLPVLVTLYAFVFEARGGRAARVAFFYVVLAGYLAYRVFGLDIFTEQHALMTDLPTLASSASAAVFDYIRLLVVPWPLKAFYTLEWHGPASAMAMAGFALMAAGLAAFVLLLRTGSRAAAFALAWTFLSLAPVLNIGSLGDFSIAERYLYIPSIGFVVCAGLLLSRLMALGNGPRRAAVAGLVVVVALFVGLTFQRNKVWSDDLTFYTEMVRVAPGSALPHINLSHAYMRVGRIELAISEMERGRELVPGNNIVRYELGYYYYKAGRHEEAVRELEEAVELSPGHEAALNLLGICYAEVGRLDDAERAFGRAIEADAASGAAGNLARLRGLRQGP